MRQQIIVNNKSFGNLFVLFLVFLVLKLTNVIAWSWFWVTLPVLLPVYFIALILLLFLLAGLLYLVAYVSTIPWKGTRKMSWDWLGIWFRRIF